MDYSDALAATIDQIEDSSCSDHEEHVDVPVEQELNSNRGIRNPLALQHCLEQIRLPEKKFPWSETLVITQAKTVDVDPDADLEREVKFYELALNSVKQALHRLDQAAIPYKRPIDYFAEMVKTDDHMARIKRKLLYEAAAIEKVSENKRVIIQKKFAKQAASEKQQAKAKQKHATTEAINTWKKETKTNGLTAESFDAAMAKADSLVKKQRRNTPMKTISKGRQYKNEKFGFGGKKHANKRNDMTKPDGDHQNKKRSISKQFGGKQYGNKRTDSEKPEGKKFTQSKQAGGKPFASKRNDKTKPEGNREGKKWTHSKQKRRGKAQRSQSIGKQK